VLEVNFILMPGICLSNKYNTAEGKRGGAVRLSAYL